MALKTLKMNWVAANSGAMMLSTRKALMLQVVDLRLATRPRMPAMMKKMPQ